MNSSLSKDISSWSIQDVTTFLQGIGLGSLQSAFETNAVNGSDLLDLSDEDYVESLHTTPLQVHRLLYRCDVLVSLRLHL